MKVYEDEKPDRFENYPALWIEGRGANPQKIYEELWGRYGGQAVIHVSDGVCVICKECGCQTISLIDGNSQGKSCGGAIYRVIDKWNRRAGEQDEVKRK